jgi:acetyltransferase-like isoleucine patch superfamily enzyme
MIGEGVLVNRAASIGHHCLVQDYASLGPGATLAGNIHVGAGAVIGAGAVVLPNLRIGEGAIVAAGAVVRGHVRPGTLVAGHPARPHSHNPARSSLNVEDGE